MEYFLFTAAAFHAIYYSIYVMFTDSSWLAHLYWPACSMVLFAFGLLLWWDRRRKEKHLWHLPLRFRTFLAATSALYIALILVFAAATVAASFTMEEEESDYIILIENSNVSDELTEDDMDALDCAVRHLKEAPDSKLILAGASRFTSMNVNEAQVQDKMISYLLQNGISEDRIMKERVSKKLRQNLTYSLAYILADWYGNPQTDNETDPIVSVIAGKTSVLRYRYVLKNTWWDMRIITYGEDLLTWPARVIEEVELFLRFHLENHYIYKMGGNYGKFQF